MKFKQKLTLIVLILINVKEILSHDASSLKALKVTDSSITVQWTKESAVSDEKAHHFKVVATPVESHSNLFMIDSREWLFDYETNQANLIALSPGTKYNITTWTVKDGISEHPVSALFWTEIGDPVKPSSVKLIKKLTNSMEISLNEAVNPNGPISSYQLVVLSDPGVVIFNPDMLTNYSDAQYKGIPYYITAELSASQVKDNTKFTIGDEKMYGGFVNAPLEENGDYAVITGLVSSLNGVSKRSYSKMAVFEVEKVSNVLETALAASIAVFAALLIIAVLLYLGLRRYYKPHVRRPSQQELAVNNPAFEETNGDLTDGIYLDDVNVKITHDNHHSLKPVWQIPEKYLEIYKPIIGYGKFGQVQCGVVHKTPKQISVIIITTQAPSLMTSEERRNITHEIELMQRISNHPNVVSLIGQTEIEGSLHIAMEHSRETLLSALHNSRFTDFSPGYSSTKTVTTYTARQLIHFTLDIAKGLQYLHQNKIIHQHLMAKNVLLMCDVTKLANFHLCFFEQDNKNNYSRWCAAESFQSKRFTFKSDIWSLAVLIWEIVTIGGTPYQSLTNKEVARKVLQGTRLPQPSCVSYDLFQLMLDCWQTDMDERPTIDSVVQTLNLMVQDDRDHINVKHYSGFQYHRYDPNCE